MAVDELLATVLGDEADLVDGGGAGVMVERVFDLCQLGRRATLTLATLL